MAEQRKQQQPAAPPWWLHGGDEECPHCGRPYHLEVERRCAGCDAPACVHCMGGEALCPDCAKDAKDAQR
jgi:hypothetical protein